MIAKFSATEVAAVEEPDCIIAGVTCTQSGEYLMLQRALPVGGEDDWGVHVEYNDQANSGYDKIKHCSAARDQLRISLREPVGLHQKFSGFDIRLKISDAQWEVLVAGLRRVFRGREDVLQIG